MAKDRILLVDDEPNVLDGYRRSLRGQFDISVASGGKEALDKIAREAPVAVVVSDMRMPEMNGVELLKRVKIASPNSIRMMLTGNAEFFFARSVGPDQQHADDAIAVAPAVKKEALAVWRPIGVRVFPETAETGKFRTIERGMTQPAKWESRCAGGKGIIFTRWLAPPPKSQPGPIR